MSTEEKVRWTAKPLKSLLGFPWRFFYIKWWEKLFLGATFISDVSKMVFKLNKKKKEKQVNLTTKKTYEWKKC